MKDHLKILILEDSPDDVDLIERELKKGGINFTSVVVNKKVEFENALKQFKPDVILSDHSLPQFNSIEAFKAYKEYEKEFNVLVPFILITGQVSEEFAVQCIKAGVDDYILKDRLKRLPLSIKSGLEKFRIEAERSKYHGQLMANRTLMEEAEHLANFGSWQVDLITGIHTWSNEMYHIYGYENPGEMQPDFEKFFNHVYSEDILSLKKGFEYALANLNSYEADFRIIDKKGNLKYISSKQEINRNQDRQPIRLVGFNLDITERKKAEMSLSIYFKNVTDQKKYIGEIENQNIQLKEIGRIQSHEVRAPLARMMGLISLVNDPEMDLPFILNHIVSSAHELDGLIREIVRKTEEMLSEPGFKD